MMMEEDLTLGGRHTLQYTQDVSQTCALETNLCNFTNQHHLINVIKNKINETTNKKHQFQKMFSSKAFLFCAGNCIRTWSTDIKTPMVTTSVDLA